MRIYSFSRGDVIITAKPLASVLHPQLSGKYCDECLKEITTSDKIRCDDCPFVNYCSTNCKGHRFSDFSETLFNCKKRTFDDLMDHESEITADASMFARFRSYFAIIQYMFPDNMKPSYNRALKVFGKMMINRFSVQNCDLESIGEALYVGPSIHDHSCAPDAGFVFDGKELTIRAMRDLSVADPSEIFICYIDILQPMEDRISFLEEHYFFKCACLYCSHPEHIVNNIQVTKENLRDSLKGAMLACLKAGDQGNATSDRLETLFDKACHYVDQDDAHERVTGSRKLKYWKIDALVVLFECAIRLSRLKEAIDYGRRLLDIYKEVYGEYRPCVSVLEYRLVELASANGQVQCSQLCKNEILRKLKITHGEKHPLLKKAVKLLR